MATNIAEIELKATDNASAVLTRFTASMDAALKKAEALQLALGRIGANTQQIAAFEQQIRSLVQQLQQLSSIRVNLSGLGTGGGGGGGIGGLQGALTNMFPLLGSVYAGVGLIREAWQLVGGAIHGAYEMLVAFAERQKVLQTLKFSVGGDAEQAGKEFAFVRGKAEELGLSLTESGRAYAKLAAAARGTTLEGDNTRKIFDSVAKASTVMGLNVYETEGALRAIGQMMSKGTVQSEELRGQLGERIPGAFQIFARALNVSTAELGKMLEQGQVLSADALPKFADELLRSLGDEPQSAAKNVNAELNRMKTAFDDLKVAIGQALVESGALDAVRGITNELKGMSEWVKTNTSEMQFFGQAIGNIHDAVKKFTPGQAVLGWIPTGIDKAFALLKASAQSTGETLVDVEAQAAAARAKWGKVADQSPEVQRLEQRAKALRVVGDMEFQMSEAVAARAHSEDMAKNSAAGARAELMKRADATRFLTMEVEKGASAMQKAQKALADFESKGMKALEATGADIADKSNPDVIAYLTRRKQLQDEVNKAGAQAAKHTREENAELRNITSAQQTYQQTQLARIEAARLGTKIHAEEKALIEQIAKIEKSALPEGLKAEKIKQAQRDKLLASRARELEEAVKAQEAAEKNVEQIEAEATKLEALVKTYGMGKEALANVTLETEKNTLAAMRNRAAVDGTDEAIQREILTQERKVKALERVSAASKGLDEKDRSKKAAEEAVKVAKEIEKEWENVGKGIADSLTDAFMNGFGKGKTLAEDLMNSLKNMFKSGIKVVINAVLQPVGQGIAGFLQNAVGGASPSGGNWLSGLLGGGQQAGGGGSWVSSLLGPTASTPSGGGIFSGISDGIGKLFGFGGTAAASTGLGGFLGGAAGTGGFMPGLVGAGSAATAGGGLMATLGAAMPWVGAALAVASIFGKKGGGPKSGGSFDYDLATGQNTRSYTPSGGDTGGVAKMAEAFAKGLQGSFEKLKIDTAGLKLTTGYELDPKGTAAGHYDVTLERAGKVIFSKWIETGKDDMEAVAAGLPKLVIEAFKAGVVDSDVDGVTRALAAGLDTTKLSIEDMNGVLETLIGTSENVRSVFGDSTSWLTDKAVEAAGGLGSFGAGMTALMGTSTVLAQLMVKEADQRKQVNADFAKLGTDTPKTVEQLRAMVVAITDMQDPTGETRAKLIALAPALAALNETLSSIVQGVTGWDAAGTGKALFDAVFSASNAEEAGKNFQQAFQKSFADTMGGYITQQVGQMVFQGIITPMIQAALQQATLVQSGGATAGVAMSTGGSIAGGAIAEAVGKITTFLGAMKQVLNDPTVQAAFKEISTSLAGVGSDVYNMASGTGLLQPAFTAQTTTATSAGESGGGSNETAKKDAGDLAKFMADINRSMRDMHASDFDKTMSNLADEYAANTARAKELADTTEELARLTGDLDAITALYAAQVEEAKRVEAERLKAIELETRKTIVNATVAVIQGLQEIGKGVKGFIETLDNDLLTLKRANPAFDAVGEVSGRIAGLWKDLTATGALDQTSPEVGQEQLRLAEKLRAAVMERYNVELAAARTATDASKKQLDVAISLRDYLNKLKLGELSTLDPGQKVAEGKRQFDELLSRARAGDVTAQGKLGDTADSYLKAASDYFASSVGYAQIFDTVTGALGEFTQPGKSTEELLSELNDLETDYNAKALAAADKARLELEKLRIAAGDKLDGLNFNVDRLVVDLGNYMQQEIELLKLLPAEIAKLLGVYTTPAIAPTLTAGSFTSAQGLQGVGTDVTGAITQGNSLTQSILRAELGDVTGAITQGQALGFTAQQMADAWNTAHPDQLTTAQAIQDFATANGINGFAFGARDVAADQLAMVHRGEMIFDQATANALRKYGIKTEPTETGLTREDIDAIAAEGRAQVRQNAEAYPAIIEELKAVRMELAELKSQARLASAE